MRCFNVLLMIIQCNAHHEVTRVMITSGNISECELFRHVLWNEYFMIVANYFVKVLTISPIIINITIEVICICNEIFLGK